MIDIASGFGWLEKALGHGEAMIVSLSIINKPHDFGIDEHRSIPVTEFVAQSNGSTHLEERKAKVVFQTGLTGSTGYVLSFDQVHPVIMETN